MRLEDDKLPCTTCKKIFERRELTECQLFDNSPIEFLCAKCLEKELKK